MRMLKRALLTLWLCALAACSDVYVWHQKLTVTVQTPTGDVSGASVTQVRKTRTDGFLIPHEARGVSSSISGEAVVVEVAPDRYLFVLLGGTDVLAQRAFPQFTSRDGDYGDWARTIMRHREAGEVPADHYPMMVTFDDITDPTTVRRVEPDDLSAMFGEGFSLVGTTLEITDDPAGTNDASSVLKWLESVGRGSSNLIGRPKNGLVSDQPDPVIYTISPSDFSTELY